MKKIAFLTFLVFAGNTIFSQKMMTRSGEIKFEASMPSFEEVAATNNTVSCIFDTKTGNFAALALIKAFKFKSPLMEEHFNENYMESSKFPKATFKCKIANFDEKKLSSKKTEFDVEGELTIYGVTKKIKTKLALSLESGKIRATSLLSLKPQEFKIEIPSLVKNKIAETVKVSINFILEAS